MTAYARLLINEQRWDDAEAPLKQALELHPAAQGPACAARLLADVYRNLQRTDEERAVLTDYARIDAGAVDVRLRLAELDVAAEDWHALHRHAKQALAVNPLIPQPHRLLADAAEKLSLADEEISACRALLTLPHDDPAALHYRLARVLAETGETSPARRHVLLALERAPRYREAQALLLKLVRAAESGSE